jgi:hypothetical protein
MEKLMYVGGLAGLVILLVMTIILAWAGARLGEALYLSVFGVVIVSYSVIELLLMWEE